MGTSPLLRQPLSPFFGSLKRASEEKEQRLALLAGGQAAAARETERLRGALRQLEHDRLEARRELQELRRQVRRIMLGVGGCLGVRLSVWSRLPQPFIVFLGR